MNIKSFSLNFLVKLKLKMTYAKQNQFYIYIVEID